MDQSTEPKVEEHDERLNEFSMIPGSHPQGEEESLFDREYRIDRVVDPKSAVGIFMLPGGVPWEGDLLREVEIDELDGEDEDILVSTATPYPMRMNRILSRKLRRIGNVMDPATIQRIVPDMSVIDRLTLLVGIRRVTHGDIIANMEIHCEECDTKFKTSPDLSSITLYRPLNPEQREYEYRLPKASKKAGHDVIFKWHVYDGHRELRLSKVTKQIGERDMLTWRIMGRMMAIDGKEMEIKDEDFTNDGKIRQSKKLGEMFRVVKLMSQADRQALRNEFRRVEGDIDLTVTATCTNPICGAEVSFGLDLADRNFFFPEAVQSD